MAKMLLFLVVVGGLTLFALQNLEPISLVILGSQTLALPLAVWILTAIAAGAITMVAIAVIQRASAAWSQPPLRRRQTAASFGFTADDPYSPDPPPRRTDRQTGDRTTRNVAQSSQEDEWENPRQYDDWDDWANREPTPQPRPASTEQQSWRRSVPEPPTEEDLIEDQFYAEDQFYNDTPRRTTRYQDAQPQEPDYEPDVPPFTPEPEPYYQPNPAYRDDDDYDDEAWDDWEEEPTPSTSSRKTTPDRVEQPPPPDHKDFEVKQEPKTVYQSGSVYSYSYRDADKSGTGKKESVYDADYRVIVPPAQANVNPTPSPSPQPDTHSPSAANSGSPAATDDDDWGVDDDNL